jgi:hypothetical protein
MRNFIIHLSGTAWLSVRSRRAAPPSLPGPVHSAPETAAPPVGHHLLPSLALIGVVQPLLGRHLPDAQKQSCIENHVEETGPIDKR